MKYLNGYFLTVKGIPWIKEIYVLGYIIEFVKKQASDALGFTILDIPTLVFVSLPVITSQTYPANLVMHRSQITVDTYYHWIPKSSFK